jgi:hypothetical protein
VIFQDLFGVLKVFSNKKKLKLSFFYLKTWIIFFQSPQRLGANRSPIIEGDLFPAFKNNTIVNNASSTSNEKKNNGALVFYYGQMHLASFIFILFINCINLNINLFTLFFSCMIL